MMRRYAQENERGSTWPSLMQPWQRKLSSRQACRQPSRESKLINIAACNRTLVPLVSRHTSHSTFPSSTARKNTARSRGRDIARGKRTRYWRRNSYSRRPKAGVHRKPSSMGSIPPLSFPVMSPLKTSMPRTYLPRTIRILECVMLHVAYGASVHPKSHAPSVVTHLTQTRTQGLEWQVANWEDFRSNLMRMAEGELRSKPFTVGQGGC